MGLFSKKTELTGNFDLFSEQELNQAKNNSNNSKTSSDYQKKAPSQARQISTITLQCSNCGGTMSVDEGREILSCPYCGSKNLIPTSDDVKIQQIKSDAQKEIEFNRQKTLLDLEQQKHKSEMEKEKYNDKSFLIGMLFFVILMTLTYIVFFKIL